MTTTSNSEDILIALILGGLLIGAAFCVGFGWFLAEKLVNG